VKAIIEPPHLDSVALESHIEIVDPAHGQRPHLGAQSSAFDNL
jgi:hypothetical protein